VLDDAAHTRAGLDTFHHFLLPFHAAWQEKTGSACAGPHGFLVARSGRLGAACWAAVRALADGRVDTFGKGNTSEQAMPVMMTSVDSAPNRATTKSSVRMTATPSSAQAVVVAAIRPWPRSRPLAHRHHDRSQHTDEVGVERPGEVGQSRVT